MAKVTPNALPWLVLSAVVIVLDQLTKYWVLTSLPEYTAVMEWFPLVSASSFSTAVPFVSGTTASGVVPSRNSTEPSAPAVTVAVAVTESPSTIAESDSSSATVETSSGVSTVTSLEAATFDAAPIADTGYVPSAASAGTVTDAVIEPSASAVTVVCTTGSLLRVTVTDSFFLNPSPVSFTVAPGATGLFVTLNVGW